MLERELRRQGVGIGARGAAKTNEIKRERIRDSRSSESVPVGAIVREFYGEAHRVFNAEKWTLRGGAEARYPHSWDPIFAL